MKEKIEFPDYFVTNDGIVVHTVTAFSEKDGGVIGIPKYFPLKKSYLGCRYILGKPYSDNFPTFSDSIEKIKKSHPQYIQFVEELGEEMIVFPKSKIKKVLKPKEIAKNILNHNFDSKILLDAKEYLKLVIDIFKFNISDIGIEGSIMIWCFRDSSDIDLVLYGKSKGDQLINNFNLLKKDKRIHLYDEDDEELILSRRYKNRSFETMSQLVEQEKKRTCGLFNGRRFWLQPILENSIVKEKIKGRKLRRIGYEEGQIKIVDASLGKYWPAILEGIMEDGKKVSIECHDPIYMNQLEKGDFAHIASNLYIDIRNKKKFIILAPWLDIKQKLKKVEFKK
jgi:predicted nucleotidyltransferase